MKLLIVAPLLFALLLCCSTGNTEKPKVFGLLSLTDPSEYLVFFSTMDQYKQKGATKLVYFLSMGSKEIYQFFRPSEATCLANTSYCYMTGKMPELPANLCQLGVTLRIAEINYDQCLPNECPNINSKDECQIRVHQDTKVCQQQSWPFDACPYPSELSHFLPETPQQTINTSTESATSPTPPNKMFILAVSFSAVIAAIAVAILLLFVIFLRSSRQQDHQDCKQLIVLISLRDLDKVGSDKQNLLWKLPTNKEIERVKQIPQYEFSAIAANIKQLSRVLNPLHS